MGFAGLYAVFALGWWAAHDPFFACLWTVISAVWVAKARFGVDVLDPWATSRRHKADNRARADPMFGPRLTVAPTGLCPWETRVELPNHWRYVTRCMARSAAEAVARADLALLYRESHGLTGWIADDGTTGANGAVVTVRQLPPGSASDPWRVDYTRPSGRRFSK